MTQPYQSRYIRLFVSSTFQDMQADRDYLIRYVFPKVRKLCRERHVGFSEVDLRWGITQEQAERGEVLPYCLGEIERCRPYFIGLIGERYGWVPETIDGQLTENHPWLTEHAGDKSITHLEVLHGVLNNPDMIDHAYFYLRDPKYIESLPEANRNGMIESDPIKQQKQEQLKQAIKASGCKCHENYSTPAQLGERVLVDLTELIDRLYPESDVPDAVARLALAQEASIAHRCRIYVEQEDHFGTLDTHLATGGTTPLVITGQSGSGKSALIANWLMRLRQPDQPPKQVVLFAGATPDTTDWTTVVRQTLSLLNRTFDLDRELPVDERQIKEALGDWLTALACESRYVLVLDGLNQMTESSQALDWLPKAIPPNVCLVLSALPGKALEELKRRDCKPLTVELLGRDKRCDLIRDYLKYYAKQLDEGQVNQIAKHDLAGYPMFIRTVLEELRIVGSHDQLHDQIAYYLSAETMDDLFERILKRLERDYDPPDRPGLVRDAMCLLRCSRAGLTEEELRELLGDHNGPLPAAYLSPIVLALDNNLIVKDGKITFAHDYLAVAVDDRYLKDNSVRRQYHNRLADYFGKVIDPQRKSFEYPHQLRHANQPNPLRQCLLDIDMFMRIYDRDEQELMSYWVHLGDERKMGGLYLERFEQWVESNTQGEWGDKGLVANELGKYLMNAGYLEEPEDLYSYAIREWSILYGEDSLLVAIAQYNLGVMLYKANYFSEAKDNCSKSMKLFERIYGNESLQVADSKNVLSNILREHHCVDEAEKMCIEALEIRKKKY